MKKLSLVTACFNEEDNVEELVRQVREVMKTSLAQYEYEHIFIDNASTDQTVALLKEMAKEDKKIKIIVNSRNFGHIKSPTHGLFQAQGDAVISLVADLQDPPHLIPDMVKKWESGDDVVLCIKSSSQEFGPMFYFRSLYYKFLSWLSEVKVYKNFTGFGLFDQKVMKALRRLNDPYPFFRGMIAEVGYQVGTLDYNQPVRFKGITKNNFYSLYDIGILGIINNSKVPLRMATFMGFFFSFLSFMVGLFYLGMKLLYWDELSLGIAPILILVSVLFSVLLFFIGVLGEYIGAIYTQVLNRPLVFEKERINFD